MREQRNSFIDLALALGLVAAWPAVSPGDTPPPHSLARAVNGVSIDQAVKMAEQRFNARVVRAEAQQKAGHTVYILRLLNDSGHVWTVQVDASSGAVL